MSDPPRRRLPPAPERVTLNIDREDSPPPDEEHSEGPSASYTGVELIVRGLPRDQPASAVRRLREILVQLADAHPHLRLHIASVIAMQADMRRAVDYAYLAVDTAMTPEPRPDILAALLPALNAIPGIQAEWRASPGPDRRRRIAFAYNSESVRDAAQGALNTWLEQNHIAIQGSYTSAYSDTWRITYDLVDPAHVARIIERPPVIDRVAHVPVNTRIVQPVYGLEVALLGQPGWQNMRGAIDAYIRGRYGPDSIIASRAVMQGGVYTAVFSNWALTARFLSDDHSAFFTRDSVASTYRFTGRPAFLFLLNGQGLTELRNAAGPSSSEARAFQAQLDTLRQQGLETVRSFQTVLARQERIINDIQQQFRRLVSAFTVLAGSVTSMATANQLGIEHSMAQADLMHTIMAINQTQDPTALRMLQQQHDRINDTLADIRARMRRNTDTQNALTANMARSLAALEDSSADGPAVAPVPSVPFMPDPAALAEPTDDSRDEDTVEHLVSPGAGPSTAPNAASGQGGAAQGSSDAMTVDSRPEEDVFNEDEEL